MGVDCPDIETASRHDNPMLQEQSLMPDDDK